MTSSRACRCTPRIWLTLVSLTAPWAIAAPTASADALIVVRKSADAVDIVEPGSGSALMSVAVGHVPHEIGVSPDGKRAVVTNYGTAESPGSTLSVIDLEQPRELKRIELGTHTRPHGVHWFAPDRAAITTEGSGHLLVIDPVVGTVVAAIATGQSASHMVAVLQDGSRAFVTNIESGSTTAIDLARSTKLRDLDTGAGSEAIAVSPQGDEVWVAARTASRIAIVDARTLEIRGRLDMPGVPIRIAFAPDGRTALVTCAMGSEVVAVDVASRSVAARLRIELPIPEEARKRPYAALAPASTMPVGLTIAADGTRAYVAATMADAVVRLRLPSLEIDGVIPVADEPDGLALTPLLPKFECHACEKPE